MNDLALLSVPQSSRAALLRWVALGLACYQQQQPRDAWETENDWWQQHWPPANGPLADCIRDLNLNIRETFLLLLTGQVETVPHITFALHGLQQPDSNGSLSVHLALELVDNLFAPTPPWTTLDLLNSPLLQHNVLTLEGDVPLPLQSLRMDTALWSVLNEHRPLWPGTHPLPEAQRQLLPTRSRQALPKLAEMLHSGELRTLIIRGHPNSGRHLMAAELAALLDLQPIATPLALWQQNGPFQLACQHANWLPVVQVNLAAGEALQWPTSQPHHPAVIIINMDGAVAGEGCLEHLIGLPDQAQRQALWQHTLGDNTLAQHLSGSALLSGPTILQLSHSAQRLARQSNQPVTADMIRQARQQQGTEKLRLLAQPVLRDVGKNAVVFPPLIDQYLEDMIARAQRRESLWCNLGDTMQASSNPGLRALFVGESGTGKTLAASYLANRLGAPLYRVDLGAVMNKYIGESEKNLGLLLDQAAAADVMLLFDEADSLFGSRTDAKQTGERYANNLTNYLLSRIESHPGIVVLTTNNRERIDNAFNRRIEVIIDFPLPGFQERLRLWHSHLGQRSPGADIIRSLASHCDLSGGQIRNAVLTAAGTQSAQEPLAARALIQAIAREYQKLGRSMPPALDNLGR